MTRHNFATTIEPHATMRFQRILEGAITHVPQGDAIEWLSYLRNNPGVVLVAIDGDHAMRALRSDTHLWHGRIADESDEGVLFATLEPWSARTNHDPSANFAYYTSEWVPKSQIEIAVEVTR